MSLLQAHNVDMQANIAFRILTRLDFQGFTLAFRKDLPKISNPNYGAKLETNLKAAETLISETLRLRLARDVRALPGRYTRANIDRAFKFGKAKRRARHRADAGSKFARAHETPKGFHRIERTVRISIAAHCARFSIGA